VLCFHTLMIYILPSKQEIRVHKQLNNFTNYLYVYIVIYLLLHQFMFWFVGEFLRHYCSLHSVHKLNSCLSFRPSIYFKSRIAGRVLMKFHLNFRIFEVANTLFSAIGNKNAMGSRYCGTAAILEPLPNIVIVVTNNRAQLRWLQEA
jgi:hypothetical protein